MHMWFHGQLAQEILNGFYPWWPLFRIAWYTCPKVWWLEPAHHFHGNISHISAFPSKAYSLKSSKLLMWALVLMVLITTLQCCRNNLILFFSSSFSNLMIFNKASRFFSLKKSSAVPPVLTVYILGDVKSLVSRYTEGYSFSSIWGP